MCYVDLYWDWRVVAYRKMALIVVHCTLSIWVAPNRVSTLHRICKKIVESPVETQKNGEEKGNSDELFFFLENFLLKDVQYKPDNFLCQQNDYTLDHEVRCIFPMLQVQLRTTTSAIWQSILVNKMLEIYVHFAVGHDKCTTKTLATSIKMSIEIVHPSCQGSRNWIIRTT